MEYAISIKLTEKQYHVFKEIGRTEYRTIGNAITMLIAIGLDFYLVDNHVTVRKAEQDREPGVGEYQHYSDEELNEIISTLPLNQ